MSSGSFPEILANDDIPYARLRVVDADGLVGDFSNVQAKELAKERRTDLVLLSGLVFPPLCKLISLERYKEELMDQALNKQDQARERLLREYSFDPAMKIKGMRFSARIAEHDLERKVNQVRKFLQAGHRVDGVVLRAEAPVEDVLDLGLRIIAETRDIAKPADFERSVRELWEAHKAPKGAKAKGRAPPDELRLRLWPCTPEQAGAFHLPANILGPRRRKGPSIVGLDEEEDEDAWKLNRKPRGRKPKHETDRFLHKDMDYRH